MKNGEVYRMTSFQYGENWVYMSLWLTSVIILPKLKIKIHLNFTWFYTRVGTLIVATIYLQLIQN